MRIADSKNLLSRHQSALQWLHIGLTAALVLGPGAAFFWGFERDFTWTASRVAWVFALALVGCCQNIGLVHEFAHRVPPGPKPLGRATARLMHAVGGLNYSHARMAHMFHHTHLGSRLDPDRFGYETTTSFKRRVIYLLFIGPLRARFAPVDLGPALAKMSDEKRARFHLDVRADKRLLVLVQLALMVLLGVYYVPFFAALLAANMLSNVREMTEHGNGGRAAYVNVAPSVVGVLLFSTPGFWYHGFHHLNPEIPYLELPSAAERIRFRADLPFLQRRSYLRYIVSGS